MNRIYTIHKTFLEGALKSMTITEHTSVRFEAGRIYGGGWTGPRYKVTAVEPTSPEPTIPDQPPQSYTPPPEPNTGSLIFCLRRKS